MNGAGSFGKKQKRSTSAAPSLQPRQNLLAFNAKDIDQAIRIEQAIGEQLLKKNSIEIENLGNTTTNDSTQATKQRPDSLPSNARQTTMPTSDHAGETNTIRTLGSKPEETKTQRQMTDVYAESYQNSFTQSNNHMDPYSGRFRQFKDQN